MATFKLNVDPKCLKMFFSAEPSTLTELPFNNKVHAITFYMCQTGIILKLITLQIHSQMRPYNACKRTYFQVLLLLNNLFFSIVILWFIKFFEKYSSDICERCEFPHFPANITNRVYFGDGCFEVTIEQARTDVNSVLRP